MKNTIQIKEYTYVIDYDQKVPQPGAWGQCKFTGDISKERNGQICYKVIESNNPKLNSDGVAPLSQPTAAHKNPYNFIGTKGKWSSNGINLIVEGLSGRQGQAFKRDFTLPSRRNPKPKDVEAEENARVMAIALNLAQKYNPDTWEKILSSKSSRPTQLSNLIEGYKEEVTLLINLENDEAERKASVFKMVIRDLESLEVFGESDMEKCFIAGQDRMIDDINSQGRKFTDFQTWINQYKTTK